MTCSELPSTSTLRAEYYMTTECRFSKYDSSLGARHKIPKSIYVDEAQKHQVKTISR